MHQCLFWYIYTLDCLLIAVLKIIALQADCGSKIVFGDVTFFTALLASSTTLGERSVSCAVSVGSCCGLMKQSSLILVFDARLQTPFT